MYAMTFEEYSERYSNFAVLTRRDGILEIRLHSDGGPCRFGLTMHRELGELFAVVGRDPGNRVVILTGTGDRFLTLSDMLADLDPGAAAIDFDYTPAVHVPLMPEAFRLLSSFVDIEVPVIAAINGPATVHAEIPVLADIVLCSDTTYLMDAFHFRNGIVPGDGAHIVWPYLIGPTRAHYFLITGEKIPAAEALRLGVVNEVIAPDHLVDRAWALAGELAAQSDPELRGTRMIFTHPIRKALVDELYLGHAMEGLAGVHHWPKVMRPE